MSALVWDAVTGRWIASFGGHADTVTSVAFSPDGTLIVSGSLDETARVWEAATGRERACLLSTAEPLRMPPSFRTGP